MCRICAAACGIVVGVDGTGDGARVVAVRGDPDHPVSRGYTCAKGRALPYLHHHPRRLDAPRVGATTASWDDTLDDLAARLNVVVDEHGADAVGAYLGTGLAYDTAGWMAASAWLAVIGSRRLYTPATVDNAPVLHAAELVAGHPQANPICAVERARLVLVVGSNPVVSHGYGTAMADPVRRLRAVRAHGGEVWVLDPRRTETAALADRHLQVLPGSDALPRSGCSSFPGAGRGRTTPWRILSTRIASRCWSCIPTMPRPRASPTATSSSCGMRTARPLPCPRASTATCGEASSR